MMPTVMRILSLLILAMSMGLYAQQDQREPSDYETQMLDLINRFRAHPGREIDRVLLGVEAGVSGMGQRLDVEACHDAVWAMPRVAPLVFNLQLIEASRWHAQYMILNRLTGHFEQEGMPGFSGETPYKRMKRAGYEGLRVSENAFRNAVSVWNSHRGFIIDWGDGPGGMQDPPGHRLALGNPLLREAGCAFIEFDDGKHGSTVHNFGNNKKIKRLLGGIVYYDKNRNDQFDPGEGIEDVALAIGTQAAGESWRSGAFRVELNHQEAASLRMVVDGKIYEKQFPAGAGNVYLQCIMPQPGDNVYMFKQMQQFKLHLNAMTRAVAINMWLRTRGYYRSDEQEVLINKHCKKYAEELEEDQGLLMPVYYTGKQVVFNAVLEDTREKWKNTDADRFFKDATLGFAVYRDAKDLIDTIRARQPIRKGRLDETVEALRAAQAKMRSPQVIDSLHVLEIMLTRSVGKKSE